MRSERGSTTIMAIIAMLVLAAGASTFAYVTNRNIKITQEYVHGLQAQYSAEAAVKAVYVAGQESLKSTNGWTAGQNSALDDWAGSTISLTLPGSMGMAKVTVTKTASGVYKLVAVGTANGASRMAYNSGVDLTTTTTTTTADTYATVSTASLIASGNTYISSSGKTTTSLSWTLPTDLTDTTSPAKSPGYSLSASQLSGIYSMVLFNDTLGLANYSAKATLQTLFRVNYYVTLAKITSTSGTGYGIYYLATKKYNSSTKTWSAGDAGDPTAYVVQYDPGITNWGASSANFDKSWPYGAFLVKKVWSDGNDGAQNEVWDNSGSYSDVYAFRDNDELLQRCYVNKDQSYTISGDSDLPALKPVVTTAASSAPNITQVPTLFGYTAAGIFEPELTNSYRSRPPDLRIAYSLGDLAEGNYWYKNTYYPLGAKVAVGVYLADALEDRMVWVATTNGVSGSSKPSALSSNPVAGATVADGTVIWTAQAAPTSVKIAQTVVDTGISIAKISMADLKYRLDSVNGSTTVASASYSVPFVMVDGSKNKITIEMVADNKGNRVHLIRVNDVLVLAFNDTYNASKYNIIPAGWELNPTAVEKGTGLKIWGAAALFYTADSYGQTVTETTTTTSNYGLWGM
ncbi:MAG: hypothetical protein H6Q74_2600 [Firmicutes bacterium]|nr:hypothetical protein [Bacillota bacterium]